MQLLHLFNYGVYPSRRPLELPLLERALLPLDEEALGGADEDGALALEAVGGPVGGVAEDLDLLRSRFTSAWP